MDDTDDIDIPKLIRGWEFLTEHAKTCDAAYDWLDQECRPQNFSKEVWDDGIFLRKELYQLGSESSSIWKGDT